MVFCFEPVGRNTAPAVALAALQAMVTGDDPILLVLAADHEIQNEDNFIDAVLAAKNFAEQGKACYVWYCSNIPRDWLWLH